MTKQVFVLDVVDKPSERASVLELEQVPGLKGSDDERLLCGSCGVVLVDGVSRAALTKRFAAPVELLVRCPCGAHNRLPAAVGN